jgi:C_GCAxxG_C_C family probable redox protein
MNQKKDIAIANFRSGLNCAQSVLAAYSDIYHIDKQAALSLSCGFGGGMGRLQETCGAVTGSFMVIGLHNCKKYTDNNDRKENTNSIIQEFSKRFTLLNGTLNCKTLLNCDLRTEEGQQYMKDNNLIEVVCEKCIADSIMILDELIVA